MHPSGSAHVYGDLIFGKIRLSLSPLTGQQYILLKNDQSCPIFERRRYADEIRADKIRYVKIYKDYSV